MTPLIDRFGNCVTLIRGALPRTNYLDSHGWPVADNLGAMRRPKTAVLRHHLQVIGSVETCRTLPAAETASPASAHRATAPRGPSSSGWPVDHSSEEPSPSSRRSIPGWGEARLPCWVEVGLARFPGRQPPRLHPGSDAPLDRLGRIRPTADRRRAAWEPDGIERPVDIPPRRQDESSAASATAPNRKGDLHLCRTLNTTSLGIRGCRRRLRPESPPLSGLHDPRRMPSPKCLRGKHNHVARWSCSTATASDSAPTTSRLVRSNRVVPGCRGRTRPQPPPSNRSKRPDRRIDVSTSPFLSPREDHVPSALSPRRRWGLPASRKMGFDLGRIGTSKPEN
jgi:hypothetical protein